MPILLSSGASGSMGCLFLIFLITRYDTSRIIRNDPTETTTAMMIMSLVLSTGVVVEGVAGMTTVEVVVPSGETTLTTELEEETGPS